MIILTRFAKLNQEKIKAVADIVVNGSIKIRGIALFLSKDNEYFIKFPEEKKTGDNGEIKYYPVVEVEDIILKEEIFNKIMETYNQ